MPQYFGRYELRQLLGRGGMGEVYRAYDTERQREVALKLLPESLASDQQFEARFRRESLLAAQLNEPHIVPIHDFGEIDGRLFIDMRLVEGEDLASVLKRSGPLLPRIAADVIRQVASALDAAHARGLVHRDVKPSNVMLTGLSTQYPFAYLVDFGIARAADQLTALTTTSSSTVGTIAYMAPERINSQPFDHRADIYALACVLFEALTTRLPFPGDVVGIMYAHMSKPPPRASELVPGIPTELDDVIARGMAKDPAQRYPSASELAFAAIAAASRAPSIPPSVAPETRRNPATAFPPPHPGAVTTNPPATPPPGYSPPPPPSAYRPLDYPTTHRPSEPAPQDAPATRTNPTPPPTAAAAGSGGWPPPPSPPTPPPGYRPWVTPPPHRASASRRKPIAIAAAVVVAAALGIGIPLLTGGGGSPSAGGSSSDTPSVPTTSHTSTSPTATFAKGGTLTVDAGSLTVTSWDPQRSYSSSDIADETRLFERTLVQYGAGTGSSSYQLHPDLATTTGQSLAGGREWQFTLKSGVKWEDGSPVTCADVKYGISRTYAQDVITFGPTYALQYLAVPSDEYKGPYRKTGQQLYDQAVDCSGSTITFHLSKPVPDFNYALTLPAFGPYKQAKDQADKSNFAVFSNGPYRLASTWVQGKGGTFVRNTQYDPSTDDPSIRRALPDTIVFTESTESPEVVYSRLLNEEGAARTSVTPLATPTTDLAQVREQGSRYTTGTTPFMYFALPNFARLTALPVRQALALSTDRSAFVTAYGGSAKAKPAYGIVPPALGAAGGYKSFKAFDAPESGDPTAARAALTKGGIKLGYPIRLTYLAGTLGQQRAEALAAGWRKGGFTVTLLPRTDFYSFVSEKKNNAAWEVALTAWGPDWPSASTIIPPLFDSRINLGSTFNGNDYGSYSNAAVNARIDQAQSSTDASARNALWAELDETLARDVAYVPLANSIVPRLHGSKVVNYIETAALNGYPDLGQIGVSP